MNKYSWRSNFSATSLGIKGKLAFKTKETHWLNTDAPVVLPISIHSAFHEGVGGDLKMNAFLSIIKQNVCGRITVLMTDKAHEKVMGNCLQEAQILGRRFQAYFEGCRVEYWHAYIGQDPRYAGIKDQVLRLFEADADFQMLVQADAESTYTAKRAKEIHNKPLFIQKAIEDILEQCICVLVLASKGYRFQFYPGVPFTSTEYVNRNQVAHINVFISIEKKVVL